MKKLTIVCGLIALVAISCRKEIKQTDNFAQQENQVRPVCGTEQAMARMTPESRSELSQQTMAVGSPSTSILLFLDFDGAFIRPGNSGLSNVFLSPIVTSQRNCPSPALTEEQKEKIVGLVKDDFSPFSIEITTDLNTYFAFNPGFRQMCLVTTIPQVIGMPSGVGGVSPFNCRRIPNAISFVFAQLYGNNMEDLASTISHELGHTFGLDHQRLFDENCGFITEYNPGHGSGLISFAPIMGDGSKRITNWFAQACGYGQCDLPNGQDDFLIINSAVVLKTDDFPDEPTGKKKIDSGPINGILEKQGDADFILINFKSPGSVTITSENIDIKASVFNHGGQLLEEYNDPDDTGVTIPSVNGLRYLKIEAASNANVASRFMTGQYKVTF